MPSVPNRPFGHLAALSGVVSQAKIVREAWSGLKTWGLGLLLLHMKTCGDPGAGSLAEESKRSLPHGEDPVPKLLGVPGPAPQLTQQWISFSDYQCLSGVSSRRLSGYRTYKMAGGNLGLALSHTSATWPPAKGVAGPSQHPRASNSFLSVSQLTFLTSWVGWLENPRDPHVIASPALRLQLHITMPGFRFLTWVLEVKCKSPYLQGKHLIHRAISPVPDTIFSLNLALATTETNYMIF